MNNSKQRNKYRKKVFSKKTGTMQPKQSSSGMEIESDRLLFQIFLFNTPSKMNNGITFSQCINGNIEPNLIVFQTRALVDCENFTWFLQWVFFSFLFFFFLFFLLIWLILITVHKAMKIKSNGIEVFFFASLKLNCYSQALCLSFICWLSFLL